MHSFVRLSRSQKARGLYTNVSEIGGHPDRIVADFLLSAPTLQECPPAGVPEVAIVGRSNSGKSSVLNQLTRNRHLARTSKTPGRTQLLNFFTTSHGGRLVDLPGYGYARVAKSQKHLWEDNVEEYLAHRIDLVAIVLVMDCRRPFEPFDLMMINWARQTNVPMHVLLNKADKLKHGAQTLALRSARERLEPPLFSLQLFSAQSGLGRDEAIEKLSYWLTPQHLRIATPEAPPIAARKHE
jgi:GTP-binding protein